MLALVTGGSRGIGRAICVALAKQGHSVAINYAGNEDAARETAELCAAAFDFLRHFGLDPESTERAACGTTPQFKTFKADVSDPAQCEDLYKSVCDWAVELTGAKGASPLILVNNAGINRDNLIMRMSTTDFDAVINTNLRSAFLLSKLASRAMLKARAGRIVNISSVAGIIGNAGQANYAAAKAGLIGLTKTLAKELGSRGICANAVAPGFIQTDMTDALPDDIREQILEGVPLKRAGKPEDIANAVAFLCSDAASYITGQVIKVDGGMIG
jgi:3-oxoacyl-[acyl-carrier protein] reductase